MGYYTPTQLEPRLKQLGLESLQDLLNQVASASAEWPGPASITVANPDEIELVRNVLYSMLHVAGLKPLFQVKRIGSSLVIEKKSGTQRVGVSFIPGGDGEFAPPEKLEPLGDEGLIEKE